MKVIEAAEKLAELVRLGEGECEITISYTPDPLADETVFEIIEIENPAEPGNPVRLHVGQAILA